MTHKPTDRHGYRASFGGGHTKRMSTFWRPSGVHEADDPAKIPAKFKRLRLRANLTHRSRLEEDHGLLKLVLILLAFVVCVLGAVIR